MLHLIHGVGAPTMPAPTNTLYSYLTQPDGHYVLQPDGSKIIIPNGESHA